MPKLIDLVLTEDGITSLRDKICKQACEVPTVDSCRERDIDTLLDVSKIITCATCNSVWYFSSCNLSPTQFAFLVPTLNYTTAIRPERRDDDRGMRWCIGWSSWQENKYCSECSFVIPKNETVRCFPDGNDGLEKDYHIAAFTCK